MKAAKMKHAIALVAIVIGLGLTACGGAAGGDASKGSGAGSAQADTGSYQLVHDGKLTIATSPDYAPFETLEDGKYVGFDMEIGRAVAKELGLEAEFKTLQFDGITAAIAAGGQADVGLSGITVEPERKELVDFTDGYFTDDQAVAVMKGGTVTADNAGDELNKEGVIIAVQSGTTGENFAKESYPKATVQPYSASTDCFAAMQAGKATAVCTNKSVVEKALSDAFQNAEIIAKSATGEEYAIAVSKDNPKLTKAINKALKTLKDNGTIKELESKFLG